MRELGKSRVSLGRCLRALVAQGVCELESAPNQQRGSRLRLRESSASRPACKQDSGSPPSDWRQTRCAPRPEPRRPSSRSACTTCSRSKTNQSTLLAENAKGFDWDCLRAQSPLDGDHGRIEQHWLRLSDELDPEVPYIGFLGARFVAWVRHETVFKKDGKRRKTETVYRITSLLPEQATPARLLALNRS